MKNYTIYVIATGQVVQSGTCADDALASFPLAAGQAILEDAELDGDQMIVAGAPAARPLLTSVATWDTLAIAANGIAKATLGAGLPNPSSILVAPPARLGIATPPEQVVTDGTFTFATTVPGAYVVTVSAFPYLDYEVTINAT